MIIIDMFGMSWITRGADNAAPKQNGNDIITSWLQLHCACIAPEYAVHEVHCVFVALLLCCCCAAALLQPLLAAGGGWSGRDTESGMLLLDR